MQNGITKIGMVLWGICLIGWIVIGFVVLAVDVLILVAKLLFFFPEGTGPIEGPWVMPLSRLGAGLAGGFVLLVGTSMVMSAAKRRSSGSTDTFRSEYGPALIILLVVFMAGLLALLMPRIPARVPEITLSPHGAQPTSLEWDEGVVIRFANTSSQRQILCTGAQTTCQAVDGAPAKLAPPGLILAPGQRTDVTFPTAGDYHLISPTTPGLLLDIIVDAPNPNGPDPCGVVCWGLARYGSNGLEAEEERLAAGKPRLIDRKTPAPQREARLQALLDRIREEEVASYHKFTTPDALRETLVNDLAVLLTERFTSTLQPAQPPPLLRPDRSTGQRTGEPTRATPPALPLPRDRLIDRTQEVASHSAVWIDRSGSLLVG